MLRKKFMRDTDRVHKAALLLIPLLLCIGREAYADGPLQAVGYLLLIGVGIISLLLLFTFSILFWKTIRRKETYKILSPSTGILILPIFIIFLFFSENGYFGRYPLFCAIFFHAPLTIVLFLNSLIVKEAINKKIFLAAGILYLILAICLTVGRLV